MITFKRLKSMLFTFARNIFANLVQQTTSRIQRVQKIKSRNAVLQESEGKRYLFIIFHQYYHDLLSKISSISFVDGYHIPFFNLFINASILVLFPTICILSCLSIVCFALSLLKLQHSSIKIYHRTS